MQAEGGISGGFSESRRLTLLSAAQALKEAARTQAQRRFHGCLLTATTSTTAVGGVSTNTPMWTAGLPGGKTRLGALHASGGTGGSYGSYGPRRGTKGGAEVGYPSGSFIYFGTPLVKQSN